MTPFAIATFWGTTIIPATPYEASICGATLAVDPLHASLLDEPRLAELLHCTHEAHAVFADDILDTLLHDPEARPPPPPCRQSVPPPTVPNTFSDGSLSYPAKPRWALGGGGLWTPDPLPFPPLFFRIFF